MNTNRTFSSIVCRVAAFSFLAAGSAALAQAQEASSPDASAKAPVLMASAASPLDLTSIGSSWSSSGSADSSGEFLLGAAAKDSAQPPPRRYGRPNYSDSHSNPDGSNKFAFMAGGGASMPVGNTHYYETPSYDFQVGVGRNWSKSFGVLMQFDYDHFGLQGATLANQQYVYNCIPTGVSCTSTGQITNLDGSNHVWSFTLDPTFTLRTEGSMGAYAVVGGGFYHKVTDFTVPTTVQGFDYYYGPYEYTANEVIDDYTSNAGGVNGGIGLTYKVSKFSNERFYLEARYVVVFNSQRTGVTARNAGTSFGLNYTGNDFYPANSNRTTYVPITVGLRF
jgi:hypothetical protein